MNDKIINLITTELSLDTIQVKNTINLISGGATVPFIARYRKEITRNLDEQQIRAVKDRFDYYTELNQRKETILKSIDEQGKLTDELKSKILGTYSKTELEDIYLPYKPSRKTRASIARENGLEPLAQRILAQNDIAGADINAITKPYLNDKVPDTESALKGAQDIIADIINVNPKIRDTARKLILAEGKIGSALAKNKKDESGKYQIYTDFQENIKSIPSHRILAVYRGENEGILTIKWILPEEKILDCVRREYIINRKSVFLPLIEDAARDCLDRLLLPSITTEIKNGLKEKADSVAIETFSKNLREILLSAPLGEQPVIALDPGFRTGIKLAVLNAQGNLLYNSAIYPLEPHNKKGESLELIDQLIEKFAVKYIAVGNGTASRETEQFVLDYKKVSGKQVQCVVVNESGASVYSVSDTAREEFPEFDATVRGAISIGRRLQDPLAELVKIEPKSLGVGQYQHDVNQNLLKQKLDEEVEHCVNLVGVDVNTASAPLLSYIAGIGNTVARNIVEYRKENGRFMARKDLLKVPKLGPKVFEQSAGFLRIKGGNNPLDSSAIHPESYTVVEKILRALNTDIATLMGNENLVRSIKIDDFITDIAGKETLADIKSELLKPGLDPRDTFQEAGFYDHIRSITDLEPGMVLPAIITNVTAFGAFADLGVHESGLIHISELADKYIKEPSEVVKPGQKVKVRVLSVDVARKRIALSLKQVNT